MTSTQRVCFGAPTVFSLGCAPCASCKDADDCKAAVYAELQRLMPNPAFKSILVEFERGAARSLEEVTRPSRAKVAPALTPGQQTRIDALPKKAAEMARRLYKRGIDVEAKVALRNGLKMNRSKHRSVGIAIDHLHEGFTRKDLRMHYMTEFGWSDESAWNEVSLMWKVLPAMDLAVERRGRLVVDPRLVPHH